MRVRVFGILLFLSVLLISSPQIVLSSEIFNTWDFTVPLTGEYVNNQSVIFNSFIYLLGGSAQIGNSRTNVFSNKINLNGTLDNWEIQNPMPRELIWHSSVLIDNFIYVLGGVIESSSLINSTDAISAAAIDPQGKIENWNDIQPHNFLPEKLGYGAVAKVGKYIYYLGGGKWTNSWPPIVSNKIYYSEILSNNEISNWNEANLTLPTPLISHSVVTVNDRIYLFGGSINSNFNSTSRVYVYGVDQNTGNLTRLQDEEDMPISSRSAMVINSGNYIIHAGGVTDGLASDKVYYAPLNLDGSLGAWKLSTQLLPQINCCASISSLGDYVYILGGHNATNSYYSSVIFTLTGILPITPTITPTPTPTTTPSPTVLPTPTPTLKPPVVIIPGIGASWNYEGIVHGKTDIADTDWKILTNIKIYDGLIQSLIDSGYERDKNLFVYAYDWRRSVPETALRLNDFINNNVKVGEYVNSKVNIVGHSMGGLVAAKFLRNNGNQGVDKIITLGTPYYGAVKNYKIWEGADFSGLKWHETVLIRTLLEIHSSNKRSVVEGLQEFSPSIQGLLPTFNYLLKDKKDIPESSLIWRNNLSLNNDWGVLSNFLYPVGGEGISTLQKLKIKKPDMVDKFFGRWVDGEPVGEIMANGDGTVLLTRSHPIQSDFVTFKNTDHASLVSQAASQSEILKMLGSEGPGHSVDQSDYAQTLVATIGSPADFVLISPRGEEFSPTDGILIINNPISGNYIAKITSTGVGNYTLYIGRLKKNNAVWDEYTGSFSAVGQQHIKNFYVDMTRKDLGGKPMMRAMGELKHLRNIVDKCKLAKYRKTALLAYINFLESLLERNEKVTSRPAYKAVMKLFIPTLDKFNRDYNLLVDKPNEYVKDEIRESMEKVNMELKSDYYTRLSGP